MFGSSFCLARAEKTLSCPTSSFLGQPADSCRARREKIARVAATEVTRDVAAHDPGYSGLVYDATWWQRLWTSLFLTGGFLLLQRKSHRTVLARTACGF